MDEQQLVELIKADGNQGINQVIMAYAPLLITVIRRNLFGLSIYEDDCLNEVLISIWKHINQYDAERSTFKNWICAIAKYQALNTIRKHKSEVDFAEVADGLKTEDNIISNAIYKDQVDKFLSGLNSEDRDLFLDIFYYGETVNEFADRKGLKADTVYKRIQRRRKKFNERGQLND